MKIHVRLTAVIASAIFVSFSARSGYTMGASRFPQATTAAVLPLSATGARQASLLVPDSKVDSVIDPGLSKHEHDIIKSALLAVSPYERGRGLIVQTVDGTIHASSRALLAFEYREQLRHAGTAKAAAMFERHDSPSMSEALGPAAACPQKSLGGGGTGPFRRVYIGCTGFTQQLTNFNSTHCQISDYINSAQDLHGVYDGAYGVNGGTGKLDAGLIYTRTSASDGGEWQLEILTGAHPPVYGSIIPCGQGNYSAVLVLNVVNSNVNQFVFSTNFTGPILSAQYPNSVFMSNGSNFVLRRLTAIGQAPENFHSGEWFGFVDNGSNGPDRTTPDIGFTYSAVCCTQSSQQVTFLGGPSANSYADRNPASPTKNVTGIICGHYPNYWQPPANFLDYEGINLSNPNATGTYSFPNCYNG